MSLSSESPSIALFFNYIRTWFDFIDLYPHGFTDYVILVKSEFIENTAASDKLLKSPLLTVWASAIVAFSIIRILVRQLLLFKFTDNPSHNSFLYILFNTFGLSFGATSANGLNSRAEMILVLFVSLFSMLAGIVCAGFLFEQLTITRSVQAINSFQDLMQHEELELFRAGLPLLDTDIFSNNK